MDNQLAKVQKTGLGLTLREMTWVGKVMYKSGMFSDTNDEAKAIVKIMAGQEMGLAPFESMTGINIIKGRPTLTASTIGAKIKSSKKYDYRVKVSTDLKSQIDFYEIEDGKRTLIGSSTYTIEQAEQAGLLTKDNWKAYPEDMLFARNISRGSRRYTPDVFSTPVYTAEEIEDDSPGGLKYIPSDGGNSVAGLPDKADSEEPTDPPAPVEEPPEDDSEELDESVVEEPEPPVKEEPINIVPEVPVDEDFRAELASDMAAMDLSDIEEKRMIKSATGKLTIKNLTDQEWRNLRISVDKLKEERSDNTLIPDEQ